ncbi:MAG: nickel pincer cofactor biosynthesis protein LarC [Firmicutes bacterium]|nr:nickel pincer cofactor biosynthesis protein LarC [Bacillota bacterium]
MDKKLSTENTAPLTAWFHCFSGFSGDMALGALIDAGADLRELKSLLSHIPIGKWSLEAEEKMLNGIKTTKANVSFTDDRKIRKLKDILLVIDESRLPTTIANKAKTAFYRLAEAEAKVHHKSVEEIHFHELGAQDTIIDIVGTISAVEILGIKEIVSSPVTTGHGMIQTEHGPLPNPSPAVLEILKNIPLKGSDIDLELITPTGAVLLETLSAYSGPMPEMYVKATGYGAGSHLIRNMANMAEVVIGIRPTTVNNTPGTPFALDATLSQLLILETNLDDITGENLSFCLQSALDNGALDAWITPIIMKKGRPAHVLSCLTDLEHKDIILNLLFRTTGTFGIRIKETNRYELDRHFDQVMVDDHEIAVKVAKNRIKIEYDDAKELSTKSDRSPQEIISQAEFLWRQEHDH